MIEFLKCYSNIVQYVDFFVNVFILNVVDAIEYNHQMHIYRMYIKYICTNARMLLTTMHLHIYYVTKFFDKIK
jgi:hypothetical protein